MPSNGGGGGASDDTSSGSGSGGGGGGGGSVGLKKGPWTAAEDSILIEYVKKHGEGNWNAVQKNSGLSRCGKSCRLRWANHLRPNLKKGSFSPEEERLILELHSKLGNKWARMAAQLPGRTDNEIKNYWNTRVKRRQRAGLPLYPHDIQKQASTFHLHQNNQNHHHHHHHHHHPRPSQSSPSPLSLSSSQQQQQQQKTSFVPPLSLFDPINFSSTMPLLSTQNTSSYIPTQPQGFKRFRSSNLGLSHSFSIPPPSLPPPSSTLFNQTLLPNPNLQFNSSNFELNPPSMLQTQFEPNGVIASGSSFIKQELPSFQSPLSAATAAPSGSTNDYKMSSSFTHNNSGLLDALLQEAEAMGGRDDGRREEGLLQTQDEKRGLNEFISDAQLAKQVFKECTSIPPLPTTRQWDESNSTHSSAREKLKKEATEEMDSVEDDDLSSLLEIIPTSMMVSDLYNEGAETSNGQSSEDDIGLDMQHIPPCSFPLTNSSTTTTSTTTMEQDWTIGNWTHVPEMC